MRFPWFPLRRRRSPECPPRTDAFGNTTVNLQGSNLNASTSVVFDGAPATVLSANSDGSLTVAAPPASAGYSSLHRGAVAAGQTSLAGSGQCWRCLRPTPIPAPQNPSIDRELRTAVAGRDLDAGHYRHQYLVPGGPVSIGLGSSDVTVGQIWVLQLGNCAGERDGQSAGAAGSGGCDDQLRFTDDDAAGRAPGAGRRIPTR